MEYELDHIRTYSREEYGRQEINLTLFDSKLSVEIAEVYREASRCDHTKMRNLKIGEDVTELFHNTTNKTSNDRIRQTLSARWNVVVSRKYIESLEHLIELCQETLQDLRPLTAVSTNQKSQKLRCANDGFYRNSRNPDSRELKFSHTSPGSNSGLVAFSPWTGKTGLLLSRPSER